MDEGSQWEFGTGEQGSPVGLNFTYYVNLLIRGFYLDYIHLFNNIYQ